MTDKPAIDQWAAAADKEVKGKDLTGAAPEGIDVKPLYTAERGAYAGALQGDHNHDRQLRAEDRRPGA